MMGERMKTNAPLKKLFFLVLALAPFPCFSDSPARPSFDYRAYSKNHTYYVDVSVANGMSVFKILPNRVDFLVTTIRGWYPQVFLSDDGVKLITIGSTIVPNYEFDQPVVKIFIDGELKRSLLVKEVVGNKKIGRTTSGLHWGDPIGFSSDELYFSFALDGGQVAKLPVMQ